MGLVLRMSPLKERLGQLLLAGGGAGFGQEEELSGAQCDSSLLQGALELRGPAELPQLSEGTGLCTVAFGCRLPPRKLAEAIPAEGLGCELSGAHSPAVGGECVGLRGLRAHIVVLSHLSS